MLFIAPKSYHEGSYFYYFRRSYVWVLCGKIRAYSKKSQLKLGINNNRAKRVFIPYHLL
jgi:hypothetical protein